ncbi:hypothetical protein KIN20_016115 [Parelaphostrongylus tenuis]|uniref:Uncharacterized protein n=1 Tax=Parelaphostrongylus tenuis TaxID=148309 RepID=A0AAD5MKS3_PARTN|nr:hypothetical protein KIN20_016115 [Parelaphostrongylus tenuis]
METSLSEEERRSGQTKSNKLDALSRDDLIRFVKKQLDNARQSEIEARKLKTAAGTSNECLQNGQYWSYIDGGLEAKSISGRNQGIKGEC